MTRYPVNPNTDYLSGPHRGEFWPVVSKNVKKYGLYCEMQWRVVNWLGKRF